MSTAYYIKLDKEVNFDTFVNGKNIAKFSEKITTFCQNHGLKDIDAFVNLSLESLSDFIDDILDIEAPERDIPWFTPQEGIVWIHKLIKLLSNEPHDFDSVNLIIELNQYMDVLNRANKEGARWHLAVDF